MKLHWLHKWKEIPNEHGGQPMRRECSVCGKKQVWDYATAREKGFIVWVNVRGEW